MAGCRLTGNQRQCVFWLCWKAALYWNRSFPGSTRIGDYRTSGGRISQRLRIASGSWVLLGLASKLPENGLITYILNPELPILDDAYVDTTVDIIDINHASANHYLYQ